MAEKKSKLVEIKTKQSSASVEDFINSVKDEQKRDDSFSLLKMMKKAKESNLFKFLKGLDLTSKSAISLKEMLDFDLNSNLPQRKMVELGQVIGRIVSFEMVINLGETGFRNDLIENGLNMLKQEIVSLMSSFNFRNETKLVEDYQDNSLWLNFVHV